MKKVSFVTLALVAMLSVASCKSDKCKCTYEVEALGVKAEKEVVVGRPEDKNCSDLTAKEVLKAGDNNVSVTCKNHHE